MKGQVQIIENPPLSEKEAQLKLSLETEIERNMEGFKKVGYALHIINEQKLYREDYDTFEEYLAEEWDLGRARAYQLIDSHKVVEHLSTMVDKSGEPISLLPANERQARALVGLESDVCETVWELVVDTVESSGIKPTARLIEQCIETVRHGKITELINKNKRSGGTNGRQGVLFPPKVMGLFENLVQVVQEENDSNWQEVGRREMAKMLREILKTLEG